MAGEITDDGAGGSKFTRDHLIVGVPRPGCGCGLRSFFCHALLEVAVFRIKASLGSLVSGKIVGAVFFPFRTDAVKELLHREIAARLLELKNQFVGTEAPRLLPKPLEKKMLNTLAQNTAAQEKAFNVQFLVLRKHREAHFTVVTESIARTKDQRLAGIGIQQGRQSR